LHLPVEPDGRAEEVVVVLGDGLPKIVEAPELVVAGCGLFGIAKKVKELSGSAGKPVPHSKFLG
jgi:hypothetical protein